ncbi:MAG: hypothetical protein HWE21_14045 [Cytophagia bacterium]|nr:hypothetical protein [Cytophagia bacterium]
MKARMIIGLTLLVVSSLLNGQESSLEKFERYFTWNPDSTSIFAEPDLESEELLKLPYGTEVDRLGEFRDKEVSIFIGEIDGYYHLPTFWVVVESEGITGYALNAEVINFPPMTYEHQSYSIELEDIAIYFNQPVKDTIYYEPWEETNMRVKYTGYEFPEGSRLLYREFDGCIDRELAPKNKSISQIYMMLKTWHFVPKNEFYKGANQLVFSGQNLKRFLFSPPALSDYQDPFIELIGKKEYKMGSSFCN